MKNQKHDKIFRTLLDNKENAIGIINKAIKIKINSSDIEKYKSSFINKIFQNREADIVYKMKDKNIFFLIEHQTKIDYSMPYRILEYEVAIIKSAINLNKIKNKKYKLPLVISIVLYTGNKKWNAAEYMQQSQEKLGNVKQEFGKYNLIDINTYTEKELLEDETFISKMMLVEKCKNTEEIINAYEKIIPKVKEEDKDILIRIVKILLKEKIGEKEVKRLLKKIEGGSEEMLAAIDMIRRENQMYINIGKKEGKKEGKEEGRKEGRKQSCIEIAKKLLSRNISKIDVAEITGLKISEIDKIEKN